MLNKERIALSLPPRRNPVVKALRHIFKTRNIIIITDHRVRHFPVSAQLQIAGVFAFAMLVSWASYSTGSLVATRSALQHTVRASLAEGKTPESTLHQVEEATGWKQQDVLELAGIGEKERIELLEQRIDQLSRDREQIITNFSKAAEVKTDELEKIIRMTGLDAEKLAKQTIKENKKSKLSRNGKKPDAVGGPFVPLDISTENEEELMGQLERLTALQDVMERLPLARPIKNAQMMSGFGTRMDPFRKRPARHTGVDLAGPRGAKIFASNDGVIKFAGRFTEYGNMVDISHGLGITTRYGHLSRILVKKGQKVHKGQTIAIQGSTGRSTGDHLHYEVRHHNAPLNPNKFLQAGKHVL